MYEYRATVLDIHDGDTLYLDIDLGLYIHRHVWVRLNRLNAYELDTVEGVAAKAFVQEWVAALGPIFIVRTILELTHREGDQAKFEKYGRLLADIIGPAGEDLNQTLLTTGHAVPYP